MVILCAPKRTNESVEKQASQRLMENEHPAALLWDEIPRDEGNAALRCLDTA